MNGGRVAVIAEEKFVLKDGRVCVIRSATWRDAEGAIAHRERLWADASMFSATAPSDRKRGIGALVEMLEEHRTHPDALWLVAEVNGRYSGGLSFKAGELKRMAHAGHFGIGLDKDCWDQGIGRRLVLRLLDWAREHPTIEKVCLGVFSNNPRAIHLYESLGFKEEGRTSGTFKFEDGTYADDIQMGLWVKARAAGATRSA